MVCIRLPKNYSGIDGWGARGVMLAHGLLSNGSHLGNRMAAILESAIFFLQNRWKKIMLILHMFKHNFFHVYKLLKLPFDRYNDLTILINRQNGGHLKKRPPF